MTCSTLNSVGTISLGVLRPINMSSPTNVMMDMKMEKSLMSFLNWCGKQRETMWQNSSNEKHRHFFVELKAETMSDRRQLINIEKAELCLALLESTIILVSEKRRDQLFCIIDYSIPIGDQTQDRCEQHCGVGPEGIVPTQLYNQQQVTVLLKTTWIIKSDNKWDICLRNLEHCSNFLVKICLIHLVLVTIS